MRPVVVVGACLLSAWTAASSAQQSIFRSGQRTVALYATVRGPDGRLVTNLTKGDFQIFDNGKPAELTVFSNETVPVTIAAMLDTSRSMAGEMARVKKAAEPFIDALWAGDRVRFGTFGEEIFLSVLTSDRDVLKRIAREEIWQVNTSPVWTAMNRAMTSLAGESGRRVVLTFSDGEDACLPSFTSDCVRFRDVRTRAVEENFTFYVIDIEGAGASGDLKDLSEETGGGRFTLKRHADMGAAFTAVVEELHHQYALGFVPVMLDGKTHKLEVRTRGGMKVQTRKSYVASQEAGGSR
jgi:VWFA-related protein